MSDKFSPGAIFTRDGKLTVFGTGFPPERIREAMEQIDLRNDVKSIDMTRRASSVPPLPIGCTGGLVVGLAQALTGRTLTHFTVTLNDGRMFDAQAEPFVFKALEKAHQKQA